MPTYDEGPLFADWRLSVTVGPPIDSEDSVFMALHYEDAERDQRVSRFLRIQGGDADQIGVLVQNLMAVYLRWREKGLTRLLSKFSDGIIRFDVDSPSA
jgi:hypothetical protein